VSDKQPEGDHPLHPKVPGGIKAALIGSVLFLAFVLLAAVAPALKGDSYSHCITHFGGTPEVCAMKAGIKAGTDATDGK
jgi:hypothetical protein